MEFYNVLNFSVLQSFDNSVSHWFHSVVQIEVSPSLQFHKMSLGLQNPPTFAYVSFTKLSTHDFLQGFAI